MWIAQRGFLLRVSIQTNLQVRISITRFNGDLTTIFCTGSLTFILFHPLRCLYYPLPKPSFRRPLPPPPPPPIPSSVPLPAAEASPVAPALPTATGGPLQLLATFLNRRSMSGEQRVKSWLQKLNRGFFISSMNVISKPCQRGRQR